MEDYGLTMGSFRSTASEMLERSGTAPVKFSLPEGYAAPATPLPGLGAPARPEVAAAVGAIKGLAAQALAESDRAWRRVEQIPMPAYVAADPRYQAGKKAGQAEAYGAPIGELAGAFAEGLFTGANEASERLVNRLSLGYADKLGFTDTSRFAESEVLPFESYATGVGAAAGASALVLATGGQVLNAAPGLQTALAAFKTGAPIAAGAVALADRKGDADVAVAAEKLSEGVPLTEAEFATLRREAKKKVGPIGARATEVGVGVLNDLIFSRLPGAGTVLAGVDDVAESYLAERTLAAVKKVSGKNVSESERSRLEWAAASSVAGRSGEIFLSAAASAVPGGRVARAITGTTADYASGALGGAYQNAATEFLGDRADWNAVAERLAKDYPEFEKKAKKLERERKAAAEEKIRVAREKSRRARGL